MRRLAQRVRLAPVILVFMVCASFWPAAPAAHEIGVTRVDIDIAADGGWTVTLRTAPRALLKRLTGRSNQDATVAEIRAGLIAHEADIAASIDLRLNGARQPLTARLATLQMPADITQPSFAAFVLSLSPPGDIGALTWRFRLASSTYPLTVTRLEDGMRRTLWIEADSESAPIDLSAASEKPSLGPALWRYLTLGFLHVLPWGADHILFMIGLVLPRPGLRAALGQATAFTLAHSITLALALTGHVAAPAAIVEPLIAMSIVYVALETLFAARSLARRLIVIFAFGLLHGLGFATALREIRPADAELAPALIGFNLGIEAAQALAIATAMTLLALPSRHRPERRRRIALILSCCVAAIGAVWTVERIQPAFAGWTW